VADERARLESDIRHLAAIDRPSASAGEREAAEWIAGRLTEAGCANVRIEEERAHGSYWWPLGLLLAVARGRRRAGALAALAAAALWDDLDHRSRAFRRAALPKRGTWNVTAELGDPDASRTVLLVAHHDAAHSGAVFNPAIPAALGRRFPRLLERTNTSPPLLWLVFGGPALVALGAAARRPALARAGTALSWGACAVLADIGSRATVPGANDNLSGVGTLLALARRLAAEPVPGLRVILVSAGSEESNSEGFQAWGRRHFGALPRERTSVVCVDTVGSPRLTIPESEGMLVPHGYDRALKDLASACAERAGVDVGRGLRFSFASDAQIAMHAGYPTMMLGSVNGYKAPANYHWPTDDADRVDYGTVAEAVELCDSLTRALGRGEP
jgi:peptidase M28-like protein